MYLNNETIDETLSDHPGFIYPCGFIYYKDNTGNGRFYELLMGRYDSGGYVYGTITGNLKAVTEAAIDSSKEALSLCMVMVGVTALWVGMKFLFPKVLYPVIRCKVPLRICSGAESSGI